MQDDSIELLIENIGELVSLSPDYITAENPLGRIKNAVVGISEERILFLGEASELSQSKIINAKERLDAKGSIVFPGFIDSHTHPVFGGTREDEFARRIEGVPYMEIAKEGGGIKRTVRETRATREETLYSRSKLWLDAMLRQGVTTLEAKSGYGLDTETELKQLRVIRRLEETHPIDVIPTFLGAHEFPPEYDNDHEGYVSLVIEEMLPVVAQEGLARFCDVFCEKGVFTIDQSSRILNAGLQYGLTPRFHADEFVESGGGMLACEIGAVAADHLTAISEMTIHAMAQSDLIAALLPATSLYLGHGKYAPARKLLDAGVRVVLATDFNPGSSVSYNIGLVATLAATQMKMRFHEIIKALTSTAAESLLLGETHGRIAKGYQADLLLLDMPNPEYFIYHFGRNHIDKTIKNGKIIYESPFQSVYL